MLFGSGDSESESDSESKVQSSAGLLFFSFFCTLLLLSSFCLRLIGVAASCRESMKKKKKKQKWDSFLKEMERKKTH